MKRRETRRSKRGETMRGGDVVFKYPLTEDPRASPSFVRLRLLRHQHPTAPSNNTIRWDLWTCRVSLELQGQKRWAAQPGRNDLGHLRRWRGAGQERKRGSGRMSGKQEGDSSSVTKLGPTCKWCERKTKKRGRKYLVGWLDEGHKMGQDGTGWRPGVG